VVTAGQYKPLERISTTLLRSQQTLGGQPQYFADTVDCDGWEFWPVGAYEITLTCLQKLVPLSDANPTSPILDNYPHLYLYGALAELERFLKIPPNESQGWGQDFAGAIEVANRAWKRSSYSGSTLQVKSPR
jgi:hypothetical protein